MGSEIDDALAKLEKMGHDQSGWETLFRDPATEALWEVTFPQGHMHGGGPRQLSEITPAAAIAKYPALIQNRPLPKSN